MSDSLAGVAESFRTGTRLLFALGALALASCGSGGSASAPAPLAPVATAAPQSGNLLVPQSGGSAALPPVAGIASTIEFSPLSGGTTSTYVSASTSIALPDGIPGALSTESVTIPKTPIWYLTIIPPKTVTFASYPGFTIPLPPSIPTAGKQFYIGLYDGSTKTWNYTFEGPASVNGQKLTFAPSTGPLTLLKGVTYVFELYSQPIVSPITTTPGSLSLAPNADSSFQIAESGYTGAFTVGTCTSGTTTIATLTATSPHGPSATVGVHAAAAGTCTVTVSDSYGQTASENIAVSSPALVVTPATLTLSGNATGSFSVSETGFAGAFTIGTCTASNQTIASASPSSVTGPSGSVTVTPARVGSCTIAVSDGTQTTNVSVTVSASPIVVNPAQLDFAGTSGAAGAAQSVTVGETNYTGTFSYTACNQGATTVASLSPAAIAGPSASLTITPLAAGTCTVNVSDSLNQSNSFTVNVTTASITIN